MRSSPQPLSRPASSARVPCSSVAEPPGMVHWDDPEAWDGEGGGRGDSGSPHFTLTCGLALRWDSFVSGLNLACETCASFLSIPGSPGESALVSRGSQGLRSPLEPTLTVVSYDHGAGNYDNLPPPFRTAITKLTALPLWSFM